MQEQLQAILTISEINRLARLALERHLPSCWIRGELSNMTKASSGHWYFTIKDSAASARCVMFRARNQFVDWPAREGEQIEIRAQASLYEARGDFQLIVEAMRRAGQGNLYETFLRLKEKLQQEGLFETTRKKAIPPLPHAIGIITSPQAAALRDVLTTLKRRWPIARIILYPCLVQGDAAPTQIRQAIAQANQRAETEVLLLVRGGGSLEDLWAFNDEGVARAIAASNIPIISGIGHETDFSIADFVADLRGSTPTGAAQMATPEGGEISRHLVGLSARLSYLLRSRLDAAWQHRDHLHRRLRHPHERLRHQRSELMHLAQRLARSGQRLLLHASTRLNHLRSNLVVAKPSVGSALERLHYQHRRLLESTRHQQTLRRRYLHSLRSQLELLCPHHVLRRGYSIVHTVQGEVVISVDQVRVGQRLRLELAHGQLGVEVNGKEI